MNTHPSTDILRFWFADGLEAGWPTEDLNDRWFGGGAEVDADITRRFGDRVAAALDGGLADWEAEPLPRLALILLLDQFTRNVFRRQARAFAGDARAQGLVRRTLDAGEDAALPWVGRVFLLMPLTHAENLAAQDTCVAQFERLRAAAPEALHATLDHNLRYAQLHRDIVARFGRFPHRNAVLGRTSTPEETVFLIDGPRFGQ